MSDSKKKFNIKNFLMINLGVILMAFAYAIFVDPHGLIIGGVGGISTLLSKLNLFSFLHITILGTEFGTSSIIMLILNGLLLVVALIFISKEFCINSIYVSIAYPIYAFIVSFIYQRFIKDLFMDMSIVNELTDNVMLQNMLQIGPNLLLIIFGSTISSIGMGIALKNGSSTGGVDILQKVLLDKFKIPFSVSLLIIDGLIVIVSAIVFKNIYVILYGIIYILVSGVIVDMIVFNGFNSRAINIITTKPEQIKKVVIEKFDRTVTELTGIGAYSKKEKKLLVCVMGNTEFYQLKSIVEGIDPKAFIYTTRAHEVHGEGFSYGEAPKKNRKWKKKN